MKKKLMIGTLIGAVVLGGAVAVGANNPDDASKENKKEMISIDKAESIALKEINGKVEDVELEREHQRMVYKVDINVKNFDDDDDREVYVDAYTGEVLGVENDDDDDSYKGGQKTATNNSTVANKNEISQDEAIKIAEKAVNGKVYKVEKEYDDGRIKYEFELNSDKGEVDVEIDALTGDILEMDYDD